MSQPKRDTLAPAITGKYTLQQWGPGEGINGGSLSAVFPAATVAPSPKNVVIKVQLQRQHEVELNALLTLAEREVSGVIKAQRYFSCGPEQALVFEMLVPLDYNAIRGESKSVAAFAQKVRSIVEAMHEADVVHGDIKPEAFMRHPRTKSILLTDFNLASSPNESVDGGHQLSGTAGWVLDDVPATRREHGDLVGLASVFGWLLRVGGFGDPGTTYSHALSSTDDALTEAKRDGDEARMLMLGCVHQLLSLKLSVKDIRVPRLDVRASVGARAACQQLASADASYADGCRRNHKTIRNVEVCGCR